MKKWEVVYQVRRVVTVKKGDDEDDLLDAACDEIVNEVRDDVRKGIVGESCVMLVKRAAGKKTR